jgi:hypothetical protein
VEIEHEPHLVPVRRAPTPEDVVSFVDFVLTELIAAAPAIVEAELSDFASSVVVWTLRGRDAPMQGARVVAEVPSHAFRTVLARFGSAYMREQLYGGSIRTRLRQGDREVVVAIHTSNESATGFWIRVVASSPLPSADCGLQIDTPKTG